MKKENITFKQTLGRLIWFLYRTPLIIFIYAPVRLGVHLFAFLHELFEDLLIVVEKL